MNSAPAQHTCFLRVGIAPDSSHLDINCFLSRSYPWGSYSDLLINKKVFFFILDHWLWLGMVLEVREHVIGTLTPINHKQTTPFLVLIHHKEHNLSVIPEWCREINCKQDEWLWVLLWVSTATKCVKADKTPGSNTRILEETAGVIGN